MRDAVARRAAEYEAEFGVVPRFRGGLHGGTVMAGELGDLKQQIVFVGDVLNAAARLEEYAQHNDLDLVVSGALLERLRLPDGVRAVFVEEQKLRGKQETIAVHAIERADA
jgi:adenylate cyclase